MTLAKDSEIQDEVSRLKAEVQQLRDLLEATERQKSHLQAMLGSFPRVAFYRLLVDPEYHFRAREVIFATDSFQEISGIETPLDHDSWISNIHPDDIEMVVQLQGEALQTGRFEATLRIFHEEKKEWRWLHSISQSIPDEDGRPKFFNGMILDVTSLKRAEHQALEYQQQLKKAMGETLAAEDKERRRLAEIMHDDIGQRLTALKFVTETLSAERMDGQKKQSLELLEGIIKISREITSGLAPHGIQGGSLALTLERDIKSLLGDAPIAISCDLHLEEELVLEQVKLHLYRIAMELVNNAIKHAGCTRIKVEISPAGKGYLLLSVQDDGKGFPSQEFDQLNQGGFGLFSIKERLDGLGGGIRLLSSEMGGARVDINIPVLNE